MVSKVGTKVFMGKNIIHSLLCLRKKTREQYII